MQKFNHIILLALVTMLFSSVSCSRQANIENEQSLQPADGGATRFKAPEAQDAVENLAVQLENNFIYPQIGRSYASMLRDKVKSGEYSNFTSAADFAAVVTRDLQSVNADGHLKLLPPGAAIQAGPAAAPINGVGRYGWIAPGIAFMSYHGFSGNRADYDAVLSKLREVLDAFSTARTLIIDARPYLGGGLDDIDLMFSYFFDSPVTLVMMDTRLEVEEQGGNPIAGHPTLSTIEAPDGIIRREHMAVPLENKTALMKAQIFLLTSNKTASAGEHFTLALKRTKRATLIGETTAGAGHFGRTEELGGGYRAFIPVGRTFDPDTGQGWEQTGIQPHISVPADRALDEAFERSGIDREMANRALATLPSP